MQFQQEDFDVLQQQLLALRQEKYDAQLKFDKINAEHEKDKVFGQTLQKQKDFLTHENATLDKEVKRINAIIIKDKQKFALQQQIDENIRLRSELDSEQKAQSQVLKDNLHSFAHKYDSIHTELERKLNAAMLQLATSQQQQQQDEDSPALHSASIDMQLVQYEAQARELQAKLILSEFDLRILKQEVDENNSRLETEMARTEKEIATYSTSTVNTTSALVGLNSSSTDLSNPVPPVTPVMANATNTAKKWWGSVVSSSAAQSLPVFTAAPVSSVVVSRPTAANLEVEKTELQMKLSQATQLFADLEGKLLHFRTAINSRTLIIVDNKAAGSYEESKHTILACNQEKENTEKESDLLKLQFLNLSQRVPDLENQLNLAINENAQITLIIRELEIARDDAIKKCNANNEALHSQYLGEQVAELTEKVCQLRVVSNLFEEEKQENLKLKEQLEAAIIIQQQSTQNESDLEFASRALIELKHTNAKLELQLQQLSSASDSNLQDQNQNSEVLNTQYVLALEKIKESDQAHCLEILALTGQLQEARSLDRAINIPPLIGSVIPQDVSHLHSEIARLKEEEKVLLETIREIQITRPPSEEIARMTLENQIVLNDLKDEHARDLFQASLASDLRMEEAIKLNENLNHTYRSTHEAEKMEMERLNQESIELLQQRIANITTNIHQDEARVQENFEVANNQLNRDLSKQMETKDFAFQQLKKEHEDSLASSFQKTKLTAIAQLEETSTLKATYEKLLLSARNELSAAELEGKVMQEALSKKITQLGLNHEEGAANLIRKLSESNRELEATVKKSRQDKEAHTILIEDFQQQIASMHVEREATEKRINAAVEERVKKERADFEERLKRERGEADDRIKKERADNDERFKKEKAEISDKFKKERGDADDTTRKERQKVVLDLEKLKKDVAAAEQLKSEVAKKFEKELHGKSEEFNKLFAKVKSLEQEMAQTKTESFKLLEESKLKITEMGLVNDQNAKRMSTTATEIEELNLIIGASQFELMELQSSTQITLQEMEVSKASYERQSKSMAEKDENLKRIKQKLEESQASDSASKRTTLKIEKEKEELSSRSTDTKTKLDDAELRWASNQAELENTRGLSDSRISELGNQLAAQANSIEGMKKKVADAESEVKNSEKRSAKIKQLLKERKSNIHEESDNTEIALRSGSIECLRPASRGSPTRSSISAPSSDTSGPKMDRLTDDLVQIAQENEVLNKRVRTAEYELKAQSERLNKTTQELEQKSKILQQYILRDYSPKLQPDPKATGSFNVNILSNFGAMQKMDPGLLAQINTKLQKLLEELTSKMMLLEEDLKAAKSNEIIV